MSETEINRQVFFARAPVFDPQDKTGINNTWIYDRAPDGYLFKLVYVQFSVARESNTLYGIHAMYDGHEYTHWNQFPGVESKELLCRGETNASILNLEFNLHHWECKEYTLGTRSTHTENAVKACVIVWYYLKKASRDELLQYAIKHPFNPDAFKRSLRGTTVDPEELTDD